MLTKNVAQGFLLRETLNSASCLDYVLADTNPNDLIVGLSIDTNKEILWGSDHSSILLELNTGMIPNSVPFIPEIRVPNPTRKNASAYVSTLDRLLIEQTKVNMNVDEKCDLFQKLVIEAATITGSATQITKARLLHTSKSIRKLRSRCIHLEANISKRSRWAKARGLDPNIHFPSLLADKYEAENLRIKVRVRVSQKKAYKRVRLQSLIKINSKQFWAFVRRAERKKRKPICYLR